MMRAYLSCLAKTFLNVMIVNNSFIVYINMLLIYLSNSQYTKLNICRVCFLTHQGVFSVTPKCKVQDVFNTPRCVFIQKVCF